MRRSVVWHLLAGFSFVFLQCLPGQVAGGAGAGNPPQAEVSLSVLAYSKTAPVLPKTGAIAGLGAVNILSVFDSAGSLIELDTLLLSAGSIDIDMPKGLTCLDVKELECSENEVSLPGPFEMDLISGTTLPGLSIIKLPKGTYSRFGLEPRELNTKTVGEADPDSTNFILKGRVSAIGKTPGRFSIRLNLEDGIDFINPSGLAANPDSLNRILLALKVNDWFAGTDLIRCLESGQAQTDSLGTILVSGNQVCGGMGHKISRNVDESGDLEEKDEVELEE